MFIGSECLGTYSDTMCVFTKSVWYDVDVLLEQLIVVL